MRVLSSFQTNCAREEQQCIAAALNFQIRKLPVRYLGLHLFSSGLKLVGCNPLLEKMRRSLTSWKAKTISFASRLQLIKATWSTFHLYWASSFLLPKGCIAMMEKLWRDFFSFGVAPTRKEKMRTMAWEYKCSPISCGGLGLKIKLKRMQLNNSSFCLVDTEGEEQSHIQGRK